VAAKTGIAWCHHTFNIVWGCTRTSPGCMNCFAVLIARRGGLDVWGPGKPRKTLSAGYWAEPLQWDRRAAEAGKRRRVFCGSMCDVFEDHPNVNAQRERLWPLIRRTPHLDWLLLTKRPERIALGLPDDWGQGYANVWLGVSIENNDYVWRADVLRGIPAVVRFVSYEPALGPLDGLDLAGLHWVICGGESGPGWRPIDPAWARAMRDRCRAAGLAFFFKQFAGPRPGTGELLDGVRVQEFPR
jgi:protein gp37